MGSVEEVARGERRRRSARCRPTASRSSTPTIRMRRRVARRRARRAAQRPDFGLDAPADVACARVRAQRDRRARSSCDAGRQRARHAAPCRARTMCATRSPRPPCALAARRAADGDRARASTASAPVRGRLQVNATARSGVTRDRRHLQRQSRFGARRDRRAGARAGAALAGARRHGRGRRRGPGVPPRDRRVRARRAASTALLALGDAGARTRRARSARARAHFADVDALARASRRRAGRTHRAGQGLALHADGTRGRRTRRAADAEGAH